MNPNKLTRELRKLPGNIRSPKLPGGTLISAVLDRRLMAWSDRGGASRIFGDIWSEHCWVYLNNGVTIFEEASFDHSSAHVVRLDDNPRIAIQAGRHQLPNPDFLILHREQSDRFSVRAVDAKFAVDRLRRMQISPESIRELIELPGSLAREEIERRLGKGTGDRLLYEPGAFLGPSSLLNDYFYRRHTTGDEPAVPSDELHLLAVKPAALFAETEEHALMDLMLSIDDLVATTPESELVLGMYYLRLATAARWFATQAQQPLLAVDPVEPADISTVYAVTEARIEDGESAFGLIETWSMAIEKHVERQKHVQEAARLPVRMSEIRRLLERSGRGEDKKLLRQVRGRLEKIFIRRLVESTGEIPAQPRASVDLIVNQVRAASRHLRTEMVEQAELVVEEIIEEDLHAS
jgi:hypothetical protein